jgi:transcriptional regulator with XRE-family HTH domain
MEPQELGGSLITRARAAAGLTQTALARRSGEPQSVISAYERGRRQPSASALTRLVEAAGFRMILVPAPRPAPDPLRAAHELAEVLELAGTLPTRRRPARLDFPRLPS